MHVCMRLCVFVEPMSEGEIGVYEYQNSYHAESIRTGVDVILKPYRSCTCTCTCLTKSASLLNAILGTGTPSALVWSKYIIYDTY